MRELWLVRHGESAGNVARARAYSVGAAEIDIAERDMDVALSAAGVAQARAAGRWLAGLTGPPDRLVCSPYRRCRDTADELTAAAGWSTARRDDERLRDRDFGLLDRLTARGIAERHPEQAALRARNGKFYHRPPGGESWADVLLRLRSFLATDLAAPAPDRTVVVTHDVVVLLFRYLLEDLDERAVLRLAREQPVGNCAVACYRWEAGRPVRERWAELPPEAPPPVAGRGAGVRPGVEAAGGPARRRTGSAGGRGGGRG